jgi:hypothetical protein
MRWNIVKLVFIAGAAAPLGACVGGSKDAPPPDQAESLKSFVLDTEPADVGTRVNINYDNKVTLLGAKVEPSGPVKTGDKVKVTMYWKVQKEIGEEGWRLFTHVVDGSGERVLNIDNVGPLRRMVGQDQALSPSAWKSGKTYVDEQEFVIPKKVRTSTIQVTTGIWKGEDRLAILSGPHDHGNRGTAATISIAAGTEAPISTRVPEIRIDKMAKGEKIVIDGKLDETLWATAPTTGAFVDVRTGRPSTDSPVGGALRLLWDDTNVYFGFDVKDKDIEGGFKKDQKDPHLWTKHTVEIMVDPDGDGDNKDYYEIQINPQNLVFDSQYDNYNQPKKEPDGPFGHEEWSAHVKSAVTLQGTMDKPDDVDQGYTVEAAIPWKSFEKAQKTPPEPGTTWRMNFYAMENNSGVSWSPILGQGNFHRASRFGRVLFAVKGWSPAVPGTSAVASAAPAASGAAPTSAAATANLGRSVVSAPLATPHPPGSAH